MGEDTEEQIPNIKYQGGGTETPQTPGQRCGWNVDLRWPGRIGESLGGMNSDLEVSSCLFRIVMCHFPQHFVMFVSV